MMKLIKLKNDLVVFQAMHFTMPIPTQASARLVSRGASMIATTSHKPTFMDIPPIEDELKALRKRISLVCSININTKASILAR